MQCTLIVPGTCTIAAGSTIVVSFMGVHMDPKIYPDPFLFDPDRFSHENAAGRGRSTFIPFSGGPRNCIGERCYCFKDQTSLNKIKLLLLH